MIGLFTNPNQLYEFFKVISNVISVSEVIFTVVSSGEVCHIA